MRIHPISLVFATLMLLAVLTQGQETLKAASIVPLAAAAEEAALKVAPAPVCNEVCFDGCTAQQGNITECGVKCHCPEEAEKLTVSLKKQDRCWDQCRQNCIMNMFTGGSSDKPSWTCFADCTCVCNVGCTDSCEKDGVLNQICLSSCGCPADMEQTEKLLERSDKYYELPLDPRTDEQMNAAFEGKLADILDGEATHKANKQKKILKKSLRKIKYKWDDYVENAKSLGLDPAVFCDQTCSDQCFQNSNAAEVSIYEILTTCLISECKCFQPKLPYASDKVSFEGLLTLKGFINDQILEDTPVQPIVQPIAPVLPVTPVQPSVQPTAPVQPVAPVQPIVQPTIPVQPTAQPVAPITEPTIQPSSPADAIVHSTPAPLPPTTPASTTTEVPAQTTHETPSETGEVKTESGPAAPSPTPATEVTPPVVEPTPTASIPATEPAYAPTPVTPEAPPAPVAESTPAPVAEPTPAPVAEPTPAPATEPAPTPAAEPTPAPVVEPTPAPVTEPTPAAEPTPTPAAPVTEEAPTPAPAAEPTPVPAPSADETPVPAPAPEATTPTQDPVPTSPTTPETPATTPEAPATAPEISEIHATPLEAGVECNLTCFSECLELKKLSPYPVIQQCVETRCHCAIDESSQKIDAVQQMVGLAAVDAVAPTGSAWGSFLRFLVSIIIIAFIFATAFIAYMVYGRKENGVFGKIGQFKNKAQNYGSMFKGSKNDSDEWGYREHDAYERLT